MRLVFCWNWSSCASGPGTPHPLRSSHNRIGSEQETLTLGRWNSLIIFWRRLAVCWRQANLYYFTAEASKCNLTNEKITALGHERSWTPVNELSSVQWSTWTRLSVFINFPFKIISNKKSWTLTGTDMTSHNGTTTPPPAMFFCYRCCCC